jgi:DNA-binding MarR family transcriptional regulator
MNQQSPRDTDPIRGLEAGELEQAVGLWLRLAQQADLRDFTRRFADAAISQVQYAILLVVDANPGCRQADLSGVLRMRQPNLVEPLEVLTARGLVMRRPDPRDRRAQILGLTEAGQMLLEELRVAHDDLIDAYQERLGPEGYRRLVELLSAFVKGAETSGR